MLSGQHSIWNIRNLVLEDLYSIWSWFLMIIIVTLINNNTCSKASFTLSHQGLVKKDVPYKQIFQLFKGFFSKYQNSLNINSFDGNTNHILPCIGDRNMLDVILLWLSPCKAMTTDSPGASTITGGRLVLFARCWHQAWVFLDHLSSSMLTEHELGTSFLQGFFPLTCTFSPTGLFDFCALAYPAAPQAPWCTSPVEGMLVSLGPSPASNTDCTHLSWPYCHLSLPATLTVPASSMSSSSLVLPLLLFCKMGKKSPSVLQLYLKGVNRFWVRMWNIPQW